MFHLWGVADDDPIGSHSIVETIVNDRVETFEFKLMDPLERFAFQLPKKDYQTVMALCIAYTMIEQNLYRGAIRTSRSATIKSEHVWGMSGP